MPESWITFTDEDVFAADSKERLSIVAIRKRDDLADICSQVTDQIREAYLNGGRELGDEGTIPAGLKARAIALATWRFVSEGVPKNEGLQTKSRQDSFTEATEFLFKIASREIKGAGSAQIVCKPTRRATRERLDGLL